MAYDNLIPIDMASAFVAERIDVPFELTPVLCRQVSAKGLPYKSLLWGVRADGELVAVVGKTKAGEPYLYEGGRLEELAVEEAPQSLPQYPSREARERAQARRSAEQEAQQLESRWGPTLDALPAAALEALASRALNPLLMKMLRQNGRVGLPRLVLLDAFAAGQADALLVPNGGPPE